MYSERVLTSLDLHQIGLMQICLSRPTSEHDIVLERGKSVYSERVLTSLDLHQIGLMQISLSVDVTPFVVMTTDGCETYLYALDEPETTTLDEWEDSMHTT